MAVKCPCGAEVTTKFCPDCGRVADPSSLHGLQIYCREQKKHFLEAARILRERDLNAVARLRELEAEAEKWSVWAEKLGGVLIPEVS